MATKICNCPPEIKSKCPCKECSACSAKLFDGFTRCSMIMASAGTGKTYSLAMRYLQLLLFGVTPQEILAVTFTRKASGEIFDKIINRLLEILKDAPCCNLSEKQRFSSILRALLCSENEFRISTIDSFLSGLIHTFAPELGVDGDITMIDEYDYRPHQKILRQWLKDTDRNASQTEKDELRELLKDSQKGDQINFENGMISVFETAREKYDYLSSTSVWGKPFKFEEKLKNFTDDERLKTGDYIGVYAGLQPEGAKQTRLKALSEYISDNKRGNIPDVIKKLLGTNLNANNPENWLFENGTQLYYTSREKEKFPSDVSDYLRKAFRFILKEQMSLLHKKAQAVRSLGERFEKIYEKDVRGKGILTFNDLKILIRNSGENEPFHLKFNDDMNMEERLDATLNHYLFDEFQDTSRNEWYIFENLVGEIYSGEDDRFRSLFCVGDIKQSIYKWRGAEPAIFCGLIDTIRQQGVDPCKSLNKSYRSSQDILDTVNRVFLSDTLPKFFRDSVNYMQFNEHVSDKTDLPGFSALINIADKKNALDIKARIIADILRKTAPFSRKKKLTVGILMQKNDLCTALAEQLANYIDLPISIDGIIKPQTSMAFSVLKELIMLAEHPEDRMARGFLDMLTVDGKLFTPADIAGEMEYSFIDEPDYDKLALAIKRDIFKLGLAGFIQHFLETFGKRFNKFDFDRIDAARTLAENFTGTPDEYLYAIDKWHRLKDQSVSSTIQFMTIHKSKGLEFDMVFLPEMNTQKSEVYNEMHVFCTENDSSVPLRINYFPSAELCRMVPELQEYRKEKNLSRIFDECCKFYVAMTRAKQAMYIFTEKPDISAEDMETQEDITFEQVMSKALTKVGKLAKSPQLDTILEAQADLGSRALLYSTGTENCLPQEENTDNGENNETATAMQFPKIIQSSARRFLASHQHSFTVAPDMRFTSFHAAETGTLLHDLFEKIDYADENFDPQEFLDSHDATDETARELFITAMEKNTEIRLGLQKPSVPHILWKERRFLLKGDKGELIPGAFDRVIITTDANGGMESAEILDYKSDRVETPEELVQRHRRQLELYRTCLHRMTEIPSDKISIKLAALRMGKIIEIG